MKDTIKPICEHKLSLSEARDILRFEDQRELRSRLQKEVIDHAQYLGRMTRRSKDKAIRRAYADSIRYMMSRHPDFADGIRGVYITNIKRAPVRRAL